MHTETADQINSALKQPEVPVASQQLAEHRGRTVAPLSTVSAGDPMAMMQIMERMAKNKEVDPAKLTQIREFGEAILADQRRTAFDAAFSAMQNDLPTISAKGTIEIKEKGTGRVIQSSKYAKWEDINEAIRPVLHSHSFGLRFVTGLADDGRVKVTGILSGHGHREESVFILPHDATGSKNAVQAIGSSTSYGKRYAACALLNITTRGEDDDANSFVDRDDRPKVTTKQIENLMDLCDAMGCPHKKFLGHINAAAFKDIPASDYEAHISLLNTYGPK